VIGQFGYQAAFLYFGMGQGIVVIERAGDAVEDAVERQRKGQRRQVMPIRLMGTLSILKSLAIGANCAVAISRRRRPAQTLRT
jgi:hypothetical protein